MCTTFVGRASIRPTQSGTPIQTAAFFLLLSQGAVPQAVERKPKATRAKGMEVVRGIVWVLEKVHTVHN